MAEGLKRPTVNEDYTAMSRRLGAAELTTFEVAFGLSKALEEDWGRSFDGEPRKDFSVRVVADVVTITCTPRAYSWHVLMKLRGQAAFGGRRLNIVCPKMPDREDSE